MTKRTFTTKPAGEKIAVYEVNFFYPRGKFVHKFKTQASADFWIERAVAEDKTVRFDRCMTYLAERAARPAPIFVPSNQMELFA